MKIFIEGNPLDNFSKQKTPLKAPKNGAFIVFKRKNN